ncbi:MULTISPECIES: AEC family transporter [Pseudomonas]|uniref:AEC family transporter n=1 Tax=Pseudomonas TaxID=286 RepID=UPI001C7E5DD7|nr:MULTISPECIES: AEC family transporter [Pseudomonas]MDG9930171.1 AEC family transporter [Pseudomonas sp. GD04042]MDH0485919.1 AEC family transporter [Pseudomonas sp. GD04015]MDH0606793.1 AEC family transporter [Pseudomonas sp. GD03869]MDH0896491.1 AEC family transporter [Pseudomonas sp. GD03875]MDH1065491.1 AEC family transporter [Pseudomonas sp. GD03985]
MAGFFLADVVVTALLQSLWPLFALIVGGYFLRRRDFPGEAFWPAAERLNYFILFPALLFSSLASAPLDNPALPRLALAVLLGLGGGWLGLLLMRRLCGWPAARFGAFTQGLLRFNTYLGLAAIGSLYGQPGLVLAALLLALMVPAVNVLSVWSLSAGGEVSVAGLLLPILKNPLILACLAGVLVNLLGIGLPGGSDRLLGLLAAASLPLGLLCVGAALRPQELSGEKAALAWNCALRLLAMPALALLVARLLHLPAMESAVLVLFFALPTAPTAYVLTRQLGGDGHLMAGIITLQTLLSALSLPLVLALLA